MKFTLALSLVIIFTSSTKAETLIPQNLTPSGFGSALQPQVAVSPAGDIYVTFGKDETVYLTTSTNHGQSFSVPSKVADVPNLMLGMRRGPRVAASSQRIVISAPGSELKSFFSDDNGKTWSQAVSISDRSTSASEGLQNITALPDGSFYAVWLDSRGGGKQIEGARLDVGAAAWGKNTVVYRSPEKSVCECCHPSVISDANGKLTVMWRNSLQGNRDFYLTESTDRGDTFAAATKLGTGSWKLNACPMDGGNLIAKTDSEVLAIWRRNDEVFLSKPGEAETKIAQGTQPVLTQIAGDIFCIWQQKGSIVVSRDSGRTAVGTLSGTYPSVVASPDGKDGYLVWQHADEKWATPQFAVLH
jgi:hypothetical protein